MNKIYLLYFIDFVTASAWSTSIKYKLLQSQEVNDKQINKYFSFILNIDNLNCSICNKQYRLKVYEKRDTIQLKGGRSGTSLKLDNIDEQTLIDNFKLIEISSDSLIFGIPIPRKIKKEIECTEKYGLIKFHKDNIDGLVIHTNTPLIFTLVGTELITLSMSSISFWKYGDESLGALYSSSSVMYLTLPIFLKEEKEISYLESIGGSFGITYACGLLLLGGLNIAFGDKYSRTELYWGNVIGFNATMILSIGAGIIELNLKEKK